MNLSNLDGILRKWEYYLLSANTFYENCTALSIIRHAIEVWHSISQNVTERTVAMQKRANTIINNLKANKCTKLI